MDENRVTRSFPLGDSELEGVSGGVETSSFPRIAERFANFNQCSKCRNRDIYRNHDICLDGYLRLVNEFSLRDDFDMTCPLRMGEPGGAAPR